jgi:hypothetical protein
MENLEREIIPEPQQGCIKEKHVPTRQEVLSQYEINIQFLSRGCIIRVGCKSIAFSSTDEAIQELDKYFAKPYETQEAWRRFLA